RDRGRAQEDLRPHRRAEALEGLERVDAPRSRHADHIFGTSVRHGREVVVGEQERRQRHDGVHARGARSSRRVRAHLSRIQDEVHRRPAAGARRQGDANHVEQQRRRRRQPAEALSRGGDGSHGGAGLRGRARQPQGTRGEAMNRWFALVILALACGCGSINSNREPPPKPFTATKWMLIMEVPLPGDPPYIRFGDGILEGYGGCSRFVGRYVQDAVGARAIAIGRLEIDRRLCDPMQRLAESRTLEVLQAVSSYSVTVDVLTMSGSGGTLRFRAADATPGAAPTSAAPAAAAPSSSLVGTRWKGVVDGADEGTTPWLEFAEGRIQGYTGCNMLSGPWHMEANQLRIGPLATTKRACAGPGGEIERRLLSAM